MKKTNIPDLSELKSYWVTCDFVTSEVFTFSKDEFKLLGISLTRPISAIVLKTQEWLFKVFSFLPVKSWKRKFQIQEWFDDNLEIAKEKCLAETLKRIDIISRVDEIYEKLKKRDNINKKEKIEFGSKEQIQYLYKIWKIGMGYINYYSWKDFAMNFNRENTKKLGFKLPISFLWLVSALWWDHSYSISKNYVSALIRWEEFVKLKKPTKT
ncbi:MAG: hypothetical protein ACD_4C00115G0006 [uncultured bacterium (gcode 4)]|uniref:Uncharacterized protein n=1 Tax=uncultured bacterium (gcode 4) TaxID=1234023 RepID=K2GUB3_9BACT|nr:MAG: hypothetical protein ACD_4C00115G0006 [uncultured bacterium (gcode 4)]